MNCPNCGAALAPVPNRKHLRCPYCLSLHFPEGTEEGVVPLDQDFDADCPRCQVGLTAAALDGKTVGYCVACRGMLLDKDHFAHVVTQRREQRATRGMTPEPIDVRELRRVTVCPKCRNRKDTHPYGGGGNAVIDSCYRCKLVWLDAGELTVLEQFVPARGR